MTPAIKKSVAESAARPDAEQRDVLAAVRQHAKTLPHPLPDDADLVAAADALFQELDRREGSR